MRAKNQQTHAKRAREFAVRERRELKRAKKAEAAAQRAAGTTTGQHGAEERDDADSSQNTTET